MEPLNSNLSYASANDLPYELLTQIFLADCAQRAPGEYSLRGLALGSVCSRWRAAALSLPQLWSTIYVLSDELPDSNETISFVQLYLDRSRDALLEVCICATSPRLLEVVLKHSRRWRTARLVLDGQSIRFLDTLAMSSRLWNGGLEFPFLESLHLASVSGAGLGWTVRGPVDADGYDHRRDLLYSATTHIRVFSHSPRLSDLHIDMPSLRLDQLELPWAQIRSLSMSGAKMDVVHTATRLCSNNIVSAKFSRCGEDFSYSEPIKYICPLLENLSYKVDGACSTLGNGFTTCLFPRLKKVEISSEAPGVEMPLSESVILDLTTVLVRSSSYDGNSSVSGSGIQCLTLSGVNFGSYQLLRLLRFTPNLTKLDLCDVGYRSRNFHQLDQEFISRLITSQDLAGGSVVLTSRLLPRLREFGIDVPRISTDGSSSGYRKLECLFAMIESRCSGKGRSQRQMRDGWSSSGEVQEDNDLPIQVHSIGQRAVSHFHCTALRRVDFGSFWALRMPVKVRERVWDLQSKGLVIAPSVVQGGY